MGTVTSLCLPPFVLFCFTLLRRNALVVVMITWPTWMRNAGSLSPVSLLFVWELLVRPSHPGGGTLDFESFPWLIVILPIFYVVNVFTLSLVWTFFGPPVPLGLPYRVYWQRPFREGGLVARVDQEKVYLTIIKDSDA